MASCKADAGNDADGRRSGVRVDSHDAMENADDGDLVKLLLGLRVHASSSSGGNTCTVLKVRVDSRAR